MRAREARIVGVKEETELYYADEGIGRADEEHERKEWLQGAPKEHGSGSGSYVRLYHVRRTLMQMLRDRGYLVPDSELSMSMQQFRAQYGDEPHRHELFIRKSKLTSPSDQILVVFPEQAEVKVPTMKALAERMKEENIQQAIMVLQQPLKAQAKSCVPVLSSGYGLQVFQESELLVNIMEHALIPKHQLLTSDEKRALLDLYALKEAQLPCMREDDPVARYYGFKRGQVVKIFRTNGTDECHITYRLVVSSKN